MADFFPISRKYKNILFLFFFAVFFLIQGSLFSVCAQNQSNNNIVGIHLNQPEDHDIKDAAALVNSSGGDWGYVTLVVTEQERNIDRLNDIFNKFRKAHLIPIIRIEKGLCGSAWCRSSPSEAQQWAAILNSPKLHWPVKTRYILLFNEANHGSQWGGVVDPISYADTVDAYCSSFKQANKDFFVMMGGLDLSAPQRPPEYYDQEIFIKEMYQYKPQIFDCLDGWSSHSYPNPGFVSGPNKTGRVSVMGYLWELQLLKNLGINKDYCVYITETGWPHREGFSIDRRFHSAEVVAEYFDQYIRRLQNDSRVCAVTPFIINDQSELFDHFSWRMPGGEGFYPQYQRLQAIGKTAGTPLQKQLISVKAELPKQLIVNSTYSFSLTLTNGGQAWWDIIDGYYLGLIDGNINYSFSAVEDIQPRGKKDINFSVRTPSVEGESCARIGFYKKRELITELFRWCFDLLPPPSFEFEIGRMIKTKGYNFTLQFFDKDQKLVYEKTGIPAPEGSGVAEAVENIVVGECYRVVLLRDYHLPRQIDCVLFDQGVNSARFEAMIPIDFNNDGKFSLSDIWAIRKSRN